MDINKFADTLFAVEEIDYDKHDKQLQFFAKIDKANSYYLRDIQDTVDSMSDLELKELQEIIMAFSAYDPYDIPESYFGAKVDMLLCEQYVGNMTDLVWKKHTRPAKTKKFF